MILDRLFRTAAWTLFLLGSSVVVLVLLQKPRTVSEFYTSVLQIDNVYLLLATVACLVVASLLALRGEQEN